MADAPPPEDQIKVKGAVTEADGQETSGDATASAAAS